MSKWRVLLVPILFLCACGGNGLSRTRAAELIAKDQKLPATQTIVFGTYIKKSWSDPSWMPAVCLVNGERYSDVQQQLAEWQGKGLISIGEAAEHKGECHYLWATTALTEEGKKYLVKESGGAHEVKIYDLAFGEVTGIQINEQFKSAQADYTVTKINISPFAGRISTEPTQSRMAFALFDDGWRIAR